MQRRTLAAPTYPRRMAPEPSLAMPHMKDRLDKNVLLTAAELGGAASFEWSLERLIDRLEERC